MWQYRRYFDKHFVFSGDDYVFSDISATDNYLFLPGDLEMINQKEVMDTSNSKPRNLYFIKGS